MIIKREPHENRKRLHKIKYHVIQNNNSLFVTRLFGAHWAPSIISDCFNRLGPSSHRENVARTGHGVPAM